MNELTAARSKRLFARFVQLYRATDLPAPAYSQGETAYTRMHLAPALREFIDELNYPGLVPTGGGAMGGPTAHLLSANFYPDLGIDFLARPVIALEVKLLRGGQRQNSIATAFGQGLIYRQRYEHVAVLLIDTVGLLRDNEILDAQGFLAKAGLSLVVRRVRGNSTLSDPAG